MTGNLLILYNQALLLSMCVSLVFIGGCDVKRQDKNKIRHCIKYNEREDITFFITLLVVSGKPQCHLSLKNN